MWVVLTARHPSRFYFSWAARIEEHTALFCEETQTQSEWKNRGMFSDPMSSDSSEHEAYDWTELFLLVVSQLLLLIFRINDLNKALTLF